MQIIARMNVGGPAVIVAELVRGLDRERFEVILVTGYCDDNEIDYLEEIAPDIHAIRISGLGRSISLKQDLLSFIALVRLIRKEKPDVIHTHTAKAGVLGRIASLLTLRKVIRVHTFHGHLLHGYFSKRKTRIVVQIERTLALVTYRLISVGSKVKNDLLEARVGTEAKYFVSYPGLPAPHPQDKSECRKELNLDSKQIYCTFVGRLTKIKRPDRLLSVVQILKEQEIDIHFLVAGDGELGESLKDFSASKHLPVTFLGWRNDVDQILAASDLAILTSDNEGIPLTLIQASLAGLPIVSTNVGSVSDIVVHNETGLLTSTDPLELANAVRLLANDPELRTAMGTSGRLRAEELFSLSRMISDHEAIYLSHFGLK